MRRVRVLIVETEAVVSMDLRYHLEDLGYCVPAEICSGKEAVEAASQLLPDVVLIDIRLQSEWDGIEAAEEIRGNLNIPVVFLSDTSDQARLARAMTTKPPGCIFKPFDYAVLGEIIEITLQQHKLEMACRD